MCIATPNYLDPNLHVGIDNMTSSVTVNDTSKFHFDFADQVAPIFLHLAMFWGFYVHSIQRRNSGYFDVKVKLSAVKVAWQIDVNLCHSDSPI